MPPKSKMPRPSWKNSRFSGNTRGNRVRFTCCSSTSTCAKSVFNVKSAVMFGVIPYRTSRPRLAFPWFESPAYWAEQCTRLREQLEAMAEPPLGSPA